MKIAIIGWGSLIWDPGNLEINKLRGQNGWFSEGPGLPIEFSRVSRDRRLTLVIHPGKKKVQTFFSISSNEELDRAILNLAVREGCGKDKIGYYVKKADKFVPSDFVVKKEIKDWMKENSSLDAVIWTNLSQKLWYKDEGGKRVNVHEGDIIEYLDKLPSHVQARAEEYIRRTPAIVNTDARKSIVEKLGWTYIPSNM